MLALTTARLLVIAALSASLLTGCAAPAVDVGITASSSTVASASATASNGRIQRALVALEQRYGARLGVAVIDTGSGRLIGHRSEERFAFASTNKAFIAAATLRRESDAGLAAVVRYSRDDLQEYAPITTKHVDDGMTVRALLDAMVRYSDNTAANLLVDRLGGPSAVQRFLRSLGDTTTRVDRVEPDLNTAVPGDQRDTTTPRAFARDLRAVLLEGVLPERRRVMLETLMRENTTGDDLIRAGVPDTWVVADKTGAGSYGTRNDIALIRRPSAAPLLVVLLSDRKTADAGSQDALLAEAARVVSAALES